MAVTDLYDKACEAANKGNYEYAVELYRQVLRLSPEHAGARVLLRGTERRRLAQKGSSLVRTVAGRLKGLWPLLKAMLQRKDPAKQLESCEDCLETNPYSIGALIMAGQAAANAGYSEGAVAIFKDVVALRPGNKKALRRLAAALENAGQTKEALAVLLKLASLAPTDRQLEAKVRSVQAADHVKTTGMDKASSFRDIVRDEEVAKESVRRLETTEDRRAQEIALARRAVKQDPDNVTKITHLALLYRREGDPAKAIQVLTEAHQRMPDSYEIREELGDLQLHAYDDALSRLEQQLAGDPDNQKLREESEETSAKRRECALREYAWRAQQHPTDRQLRLELGKAQFEAADYDPAIAAFQSAVKDPRLALEASCMLGRCFAAKGQFDLAVERYRVAAAQHPELDEAGMEISYLMAQALEQMGEGEEARKLYRKIYANDISFRDVAEKVDSLGS